MIPAASLVELFQKMYREHWKYEWGQHRDGCVDCSGAFTYAYQHFGMSIPNGSNAIARGYTVGGMLPISQARPGMAAFKAKEPGEKGYALPQKYMSGSDLRDYYHIGLVDSDPHYVLNAKGKDSGFCRDALTAKNGWDFVAYLSGVTYDQGGITMEKAKVVLPTGSSGNTVNLRKSASLSAGIVERVPVGAAVEVISDQGKWCQVKFGSHTGFMASDYLEYGDISGESNGRISDEDLAKADAALIRIETYAKNILQDAELIGKIVGRG